MNNKEKYNLPDNFPDSLFQKAIELEQLLGVNELAWRFEDVNKAIDFLEANDFVILGGDVLINKDDGLQHTYDNWYYNINETYSSAENIKLSKKIAREYILDFSSKKGFDNFFYILVFKKFE